jgi:hypothetical protein
MREALTRWVMEAVDAEDPGVIGIRVDIADLAELPPTGWDATLAAVAASIGIALVVGGILVTVTHRRFSGRSTDAR